MTDTALNPVDVEKKIQETSNRIASGVGVVTAAQRDAKAKRRDFDLAYALAFGKAEGSIEARKYSAVVETMDLRRDAEEAEISFKHAERTAEALERELFAWQSIGNSVRAMYGAVKA